MHTYNQPPPSGLRCPQCHSTILPGQLVCPLCGHNMNDYVVIQPMPRTWQENLYLVFSILLVLQGIFLCALGGGLIDGHTAWPLAYIGLGIIIVGIGLTREQLWAQWTARAAGILAILGSAFNALRMGLSIGSWPHAKENCLASVAVLVYWSVMEYLIVVVGE